MTTRELDKLLFTALKYSSVVRVNKLLQEGADPNAKDEVGFPALHYTVKLSTRRRLPTRIDMAKLLLDSGANVDAESFDGKTALEISVQEGDLEMVDVLLGYGADVSKGTLPPLIVSALQKSARIMQTILDKEADVNVRDKLSGSTALHYAVEEAGAEHCVDILLRQRDIELNLEDNCGFTPFHCAVNSASFDVILELLKHGAISTDSILANAGSLSASKISCDDNVLTYFSGPLKGLSIPISKSGIDINHKTFKGDSVLHLAVQGLRSVEIIEALLSLGVDIDGKNNEGFTPLMTSVRFGCPETILTLLKNGADVNARNNSGMTALFLICDNDRSPRDNISILFEYGADINITANAFPNQTALLYAGEMFRKLRLADGHTNMNPFEQMADAEYEDYVVHLCRHVITLKTANEFSVNETNLQCTYLSDKSLLELQNVCKAELAILRKVRVADSNRSFYDFLTRKPNVLARCSQSESVASFLASGGHASSYPVYESLLKYRFRMALERSRLIDDAMLAGMKLFPVLPTLCVDAICDYLKNVDLKNLIKACGSKLSYV